MSRTGEEELSCRSISDSGAVRAPSAAELPEGTAQPRAEQAGKEAAVRKYKGRANRAGRGKVSNQSSPNAPWQRWESSCSSLPGNG